MEPDALRQFYEQETVRETVKAYAHDLLDTLALKDVYAGKDTKGYAEAKKTVDKLFATLEEKYGERTPPLTTNQAK